MILGFENLGDGYGLEHMRVYVINDDQVLTRTDITGIGTFYSFQTREEYSEYLQEVFANSPDREEAIASETVLIVDPSEATLYIAHNRVFTNKDGVVTSQSFDEFTATITKD